ncbi:hypothetical protein GCM10028857_06120 [Salinarchaeum chitinilyticum]
MSLARHGTGPVAALRALASQVHPVFMLPPIAAAWFGAVLGGLDSAAFAAVHSIAIFAAVYTAHVKDGYVDFHVRGEDDDHPLTVVGCRVALVGATALFAAAVVVLWIAVNPIAAFLTIPTWVIGYHHAPQLDTNPLTATTGYPAGIALAIVGGYYVQTAAIAPVPIAFALVFLLVLSGVKVIDDAQDYDYDRSIDKRTVAVTVGPPRARRIAYGLIALGFLVVLALAAVAVFPPTSVLAVAAFGAVVLATRRADPEIATMLLIRGAYVFLAVLVAAVWFEPLG